MDMPEPSVFTRILAGEIPGEVIYKDDQCFVILTIDPLTPGHMLVVPLEEIDSLWDIETPLYHHLMDISKKMAKVIEKAYEYRRVGTAVEGFGVPHAHIHVFGLNEGINRTIVAHEANPHTATPEELKIEADKLRACL